MGSEPVQQAVGEVGQRYGWDEYWLDVVALAVAGRAHVARPVYGDPFLTMTGISRAIAMGLGVRRKLIQRPGLAQGSWRVLASGCDADSVERLHGEPLAHGVDPELPKGRRDWPLKWRVVDYVCPVQAGWTDDECYRWLVSQLARTFHGSTTQERTLALASAPPCTGTRWDALLAAVIEHVCLTHRRPVPPWCDEEARFLEKAWLPLRFSGEVLSGVNYRDVAGAFLRHGVLVGHGEMSFREGECDYGSLFV